MADKTPRNALAALKKDIAAKALKNLYILYGEESYLREYYLGEMKKAVLEGGAEDFNLRVLDGSKLSIDELTEAIEAYPAFASRTFVEVRDFDPFKCNEQVSKSLVDLFDNLPDFCCLTFVFDSVPYKPDKRKKKLYAAIEQAGTVVELAAQPQSSLVSWILRRFEHVGHTISREDAEYLIFLCGDLMTGLIGEIDKIASYCNERQVTRADIDAVAVPVPDAVAFHLARYMVQGDFRAAGNTLFQLFEMREQSLRLLGAISSQMRNLYAARLAMDCGKDAAYLKRLMGMRTDYQARAVFDEARRITLPWCENALEVCCQTDARLKSTGAQDTELMAELIVRIMGEQAACARG